MTGPVRNAYDGLVAAGELKPDAAQARGADALDRLAASLDEDGGLLGRLLRRRADGPAGVYLWGGVVRNLHRRGAETPGPFPRFHARDALAAARGAEE